MNFIEAAYIIILCIFLPLYMEDGYYKLGEAKGIAFLWISGIFLTISLVAVIIRAVMAAVRKKPIFPAAKDEVTVFLKERAFLLIFILFQLISYIFSIDKEVALKGLDGWRTGFMTWGFAAALALFISVYGFTPKKGTGIVVVLCLLVPFSMFLLGILNRFGIYPFEVSGVNDSYLATLGNINWYTGYLSVFVPVGAGLCYREKRFSKGFFLCAVYEVVGFTAIFLQGSESALLIIAAVFLLLGTNGLRDRENLKNCLLQFFLLGLSMEAAGLLYLFFRESYTYEESALILLCSRHIGLIIMAASVCIYRLSRLFENISVSYKKNLYRMILWGITVAAGGVAILFLVNNLTDDFGNGRGLIWRISTLAFSKESFFQKLVGVGQDCYHPFIRSDQELTAIVKEAFGGSRLTNAHCEPLTVLIQTGFLGAAAYLCLMVGSILGLMFEAERGDDGEKANYAIVFALPIAAYFLNSLVSFPQTVSTPYMFICIGIGLKIISDNNKSRSSS